MSWLLVAASLLVWPGPESARAAIAENGSEVTACTTASDTVTLPSWTPSADDVILLWLFWREDGVSINTVSGNGLTWNQVACVTNEQLQNEGCLYSASAGSSPSTGSIVAQTSASAVAFIGVAQRFSGVDDATADGVEASSTNDGPAVDDDDMLHSVTTVTANAWAFAAGGGRGDEFTAPMGETLIVSTAECNTGGNRIQAHVWYEGPVASPGSVQLGAANDLSGTDDWIMITAALKPDTGGGGGAAAPPTQMLQGVGD
jgi:hypothetical protein